MITEKNVHSITFSVQKYFFTSGGSKYLQKNTWGDWGLVPTSRPVVNPPTRKQKIIEIPGRDGYLDLSNSLIGQDLYNRRTGTWEFAVYDSQKKPWSVLCDEISNFFIGCSEKIKVILLDDPRWYYVGYVTMKEWKSNNDGTGSRITFEYDLEPYKRFYVLSSDPEELWDNYLFEDLNGYYNLFNKRIPDDYNSNAKNSLYWNALWSYGIYMPTVLAFEASFVNTSGKKILVRRYGTNSDGSVTDSPLMYVLDNEYPGLTITGNANSVFVVNGTEYNRAPDGKAIINGNIFDTTVAADIKVTFEIGRL